MGFWFVYTLYVYFLLDFNYTAEFTRQFLSISEIEADTISNATTTPLLREWAKATLANGEWKGALIVAANVSTSHFFHTDGIAILLVCSSHFPELKSIWSYVNVLKLLTA